MIGPSDVAYVICILKNNIEVWRYDPTDTTKEHPKPVFTRGESKKREFGRMTWSDNGIKYYEEGVKNWKRVFDRRQPYFEALHEGWDSWLEDAAGVVNPDGWTRKNIRNVLRTRAEKDSPSASKGGSAREGANNGYCDHGYDIDDDIGPLLAPGRVVDADHLSEEIGDTESNRHDGEDDDSSSNDEQEDEEGAEDGDAQLSAQTAAGMKRGRAMTGNNNKKARARVSTRSTRVEE